MIYELRIYTCLPGRLPALHKRFESATLKLWDKHGIRPVGFWTTVIGVIVARMRSQFLAPTAYSPMK